MDYNYIKKGDCLELIKTLPDNSIDLVITDPPYVIETNGAGLYKQKDKRYVEDLRDIKDGFDVRVLDELCRVMKKINIYIWCSQKQIPALLDYFVKNKKCNWNLLTWHKSNPVPACGNKYLTDTEYLLFFREKGVKIYGDFSSKFTYYVTPLNQKDKRKYGHPTIKPLEIIENLIVNSSQENDIVLDPYIGSGTVAVACINKSRRYIGYEINDTFYNIAEDRILDAELGIA